MGGIVAAALLLTLASGCRKSGGVSDAMELREPLIRRAKAKCEIGDKDGAIACLNEVLDRKPRLAQAQLEIALLYDDYRQDYARAIYHYQRYLELRPDTEKRKMIEDLIHKAKISFAVSMAQMFPLGGKKMDELLQENARLQSELREVRSHLAQMLAAGAAAKPGGGAPGPAKEIKPIPPGASPTGMVYRVQACDTLSSIAAKFWQDPRQWNRIYEANQNVISNASRLRVGQVLVIPP